MKKLLILALMLRVWWTPTFQKETSGIVIAGSTQGTMLIRTDDGKIALVGAGSVTKSEWEDVQAK